MKDDEIKEKQLKEVLYGLDYIGNKIKNDDGKLELGVNNCKLLLDYITNLQQENERLKKLEYKFVDDSGDNESFTLEEYLDIGNKLYDSEREKEDYKSRCEKANKELINSKEYQMAIAMELNAKQSILIKLDNTLNGRSDE